MNLITATNLRVSLGAQEILKGVSFALPPGSMVGLVGPNGSGKSTLLRTVLGLQPRTAGGIRSMDDDLDLLPSRERARRLGYLPQAAHLHWPLPVAEIVALGRHPHRRAWHGLGADDRQVIAHAMTLANVTHLAHRSSAELSGGEQMRVHLARLLAGEHRVLLLDEPTTSLDPRYQLQMLNSLRGIVAGGIGVLMVLHELTLAASYCDSIVVLNEGRVEAADIPSRALNDEVLARVFQVRAMRGSFAGREFLSPVALAESASATKQRT